MSMWLDRMAKALDEIKKQDRTGGTEVSMKDWRMRVGREICVRVYEDGGVQVSFAPSPTCYLVMHSAEEGAGRQSQRGEMDSSEW